MTATKSTRASKLSPSPRTASASCTTGASTACTTSAAEQVVGDCSVEPRPLGRKLLTKLEVCAELRVSVRSLDKMLARREFPLPVRLGKKDFWSTEPVRHWLDRRFAVQDVWRIS